MWNLLGLIEGFSKLISLHYGYLPFLQTYRNDGRVPVVEQFRVYDLQ